MKKNVQINQLMLIKGIIMKPKYLQYIAVAVMSGYSICSFATDDLEIKSVTEKGTSSFTTGEIGTISNEMSSDEIKQILAKYNHAKLNDNETFKVTQKWTDDLGKTHIKLAQYIDNLLVHGTSITLHTNQVSNGFLRSSGSDVYAISGIIASKQSNTSPSFASSIAQRDVTDDADSIRNIAGKLGDVTSEPEQVYVYLPILEEARLAWKVEVTWNNGDEDFGRDILFYDINSFELLTRHATVHSAKTWKTHDLNNQLDNDAPGQLLCTNNQNCNDASAQRAHDGAAKVYDYYKARFNRKSINNRDLPMISSVHYGDNVGNAFWNGTQMLYGDGDGTLADLTLSFDVIGHELTHGVTQYTAGLIYNNASGALNEAWSDILGVAAYAYSQNTTQGDWLLGEESYTPNYPGDALRYLNNPTKDLYSRDWWPDRIPYTSQPSSLNDRGGVHGNSGIANLAFVLLSDGGTHPRNKSIAQVPAIGLLKSEQIFYRALTTYMNPSSNFSAARSATAQSALDLYGPAEKTAVETAWCAVGVGKCPTIGVSDNVLENGIAKTGISGNKNTSLFYTIKVPNGATELEFTTTGGSGDADLYVRFGGVPSLTTSDCKSTSLTSSESCRISNVKAGTYYIMVQAWDQISDISLTGSFKTQ